MAKKRDRDVICAALLPVDREAVELIRAHIQAGVGLGVGVGDSDVVRWAIHTCCAGLGLGEVSGRVRDADA